MDLILNEEEMDITHLSEDSRTISDLKSPEFGRTPQKSSHFSLQKPNSFSKSSHNVKVKIYLNNILKIFESNIIYIILR